MTPAIEIDRLQVNRGGRPVLKEVSTKVPAGGITGLLGPSGSGKTTLMRAIVGVQKVAGGTVRVLGKPAGTPVLRHQVGYVTQAPSIYGDLSVRANVRYFASLYRIGGDRVAEAIETVGMTPYQHQLASDLSGGQRTRVSLACALVANPKVLVLDEPTVGLDPVLREELWKKFHELAAEGITLLVSSHVMDEAGRCDRLLLIRDGEFVADETPDELRRATGTDDLEQAFLRIINELEGAN